MRLEGRRIGILVEQLYEDMELWYPYYRLKEEAADVSLIGPKAGQNFPSKHGYNARSDKAAGEVSADDYDGLIIPGGYSPDHMRRTPAMVDITRDMVTQDKPVGAICHAGWMLCEADVVRGRQVTSFHSIRKDMEHAGARWSDREVVQDGNLITSRFPPDLPAFMRAFIARFVE